MNISEKDRIKTNLETLEDAFNTIELYGDTITEAIELIGDCNKVVHCVNCKNRLTQLCPVYSTNGFTDDDWYCADGEAW